MRHERSATGEDLGKLHGLVQELRDATYRASQFFRCTLKYLNN